MAETLWSQDIFTKGELSPLMYARSDVDVYFKGLRQAKNVMNLPQGAAIKRFGLKFQNTLTPTDPDTVIFKTFQYKNECVYQIVIYPGNIDIYLEGNIMQNLASGIAAGEISDIDTTIIEDRFRICTGHVTPFDIVRSGLAPDAITGFTADHLVITTPIALDVVFPARFTGGPIPVTVPAIIANKTYFVYSTTTTTIEIYTTAVDAAARTNKYTVSSAGVGANVIIENNWGLTNVVFKTVPSFSFNNAYAVAPNVINPGATSGNTTLTATVAVFTADMIGGIVESFLGGSAYITGFTSTTILQIQIKTPFTGITASVGRHWLITEPVWSAARGFARKCSSYQSRAVFANTESQPNAIWLSNTNGYNEFDMLNTDDDGPISYLPTSDQMGFINYLTPYRTFTVHANNGVYSTPLAADVGITPSNFSLVLQDASTADTVEPREIDNQIIIISGNDAHSLIWDGLNNAYRSSVISVVNEQVLRGPIDEAPFADLTRAGSRYMFIVNADGSLAMYQTLISEEISGWTRSFVEQSYGDAKFIAVTSNFDGRCWFIVQRDIATAAAPVAIDGIAVAPTNTIQATGVALSTTVATRVKFTTVGTLTVTNPVINTTDYFWVKGTDANNFQVFPSKADALAVTNAYEIISDTTDSSVVPWNLAAQLELEELKFNLFEDSAASYTFGAPSSTLTGLARLNAQDVVANGDGFGFEGTVNGDQLDLEAHGDPVLVSTAQVGHPINLSIQTLPLALATGPNPRSTNLVSPKHIRSVSIMFNETTGGTVNGIPISLQQLYQVPFGSPPGAPSGLHKMSIMKGWDDFKNISLTIEHSDPFEIKLLGIFYKVDI